MKKILIMTILLLSLTSCWMTYEEKKQKIKECEEFWYWYWLNWIDEIVCNTIPENKVFDCIEEYTRWIQKKYNNPDTVNNLREESYAEVVKTCNDIFWDKK
jgi:hypothetical protein